jgi:hypothetical protein
VPFPLTSDTSIFIQPCNTVLHVQAEFLKNISEDSHKNCRLYPKYQNKKTRGSQFWEINKMWSERRKEERLNYSWSVWFTDGSEKFNEDLAWAEMIDVSSGGMGVIFSANENCPYEGQTLVFYFSVPYRKADGSVDRVCFTRVGQVRGVTEINESQFRGAVEFDEPLPFEPKEQLADKAELTKLKTMAT